VAAGVGERTQRAVELGSAPALAQVARTETALAATAGHRTLAAGSSGGGEEGLQEQGFSVLYVY
jgi:hypothetical protein